MKKRVLGISLIILASSAFCAVGQSQSEPGPVSGELRMRLHVTPQSEAGKEGHDLEVTLISVSKQPLVLRAEQWRSLRHEGGFHEFIEAAVSIQSDPPIQPWLGQIMGPQQGALEPEYTLQPGQNLSVKWHASGRHLKNQVSNPLEVQNPEFLETGLHAVRASLILTVDDHPVRLLSNEQLVPIGGSLKAPRHTYGPLWASDPQNKTALLGLGSLDLIQKGDHFLIPSGTIGRTWTLTITNVNLEHSLGTLTPPTNGPAPPFPSRGDHAALIPNRERN